MPETYDDEYRKDCQGDRVDGVAWPEKSVQHLRKRCGYQEMKWRRG
jgi:hypothetical protein